MTELLSIAPMIDWTYTHFRVFMRMLAPQALLYTEMQTTGAVRNNPKRSIYFNSMEHPIALQLGGADPQALAECAKAAEQAGYDEINLNLGCPSDKVQAGRFGACLMKEPQEVAKCIQAMKQAVTIPVSAKTRIGVDDLDSFELFHAFVGTLVDAGCDKLVVHARKAWLKGLNPKQNRTIPPVNYNYVYQIKSEFPQIPVVINGNVQTNDEIVAHLNQVDGVMLGRLACDNPYRIAGINQLLYPNDGSRGQAAGSRHGALNLYYPYLLEEYNQGAALGLLLKPLFNLAFGLPGASLWKKKLMTLLQSRDLTLFKEIGDFLLEIESSQCIHGILP